LQVRSAWSSYLELLIEPAGWLAVWIPSAEVSLTRSTTLLKLSAAQHFYQISAKT
jgi:hypothetical protein